MMLSGCFRTVADAYKSINWESIVLIAAMMPMSLALEKTGVDRLFSSTLIGGFGTMGPHILLASIYLITSVMTLFISNTATAVLMAPIALQSAVTYGVSPLPFLFAVTFGASLCFASPFSTPPNTLVMTADGYSFGDYFKVGGLASAFDGHHHDNHHPIRLPLLKCGGSPMKPDFMLYRFNRLKNWTKSTKLAQQAPISQ